MYAPSSLPLLSACLERFCQNEARDTLKLEYKSSVKAGYFGERVAVSGVETFSCREKKMDRF